MLALFTSLIPGALALVTFFLRLGGAKEEEIRAFEESVQAIQKRRQEATRPADEEALELEELARRREAARAKAPAQVDQSKEPK
jgi:hypothetical protein